MRPFETFGVNPFLMLTEEGRRELQSLYFRKSRELHPDSVDQSDSEALAKAEEASAQLNADYALLKDPMRLLESVLLKLQPNSPSAEKNSQGKAPPDLAMEYFELQEQLEEAGGKSSPSLQQSIQSMRQKTRQKIQAVESKIFEFTKNFPYQSAANAKQGTEQSAGQSVDEVFKKRILENFNLIQGLMLELRYLNSFWRDFDSKFPVESSRADTN